MQQDEAPLEQAKNDELEFNNVPNRLTLLRIIFVPLVIWFLYLQSPFWDWMAAIVFILASVTDWFDGYIARTRKMVTVYGKLLDPLADKYLVVSTIIMLQELGRIPFLITIILVWRELGITALRAMAAAEGVVIAASRGGKWKTGLQMVALPLLIVQQGVLELPTYQLGQILLYISIALSLWSAKDYAVDFFRSLKKMRQARAEKKARKRALKEDQEPSSTTS